MTMKDTMQKLLPKKSGKDIPIEITIIEGGKMKIRESKLRHIIQQLIKEANVGADEIESIPELQEAYDEGFDQGRHDGVDQMGMAQFPDQWQFKKYGELQYKAWQAWIAGYEDGYYG
tara:strand:- start:144 stop:494 length:351 start_codon:yes stop_codon:yes gene_type:complete